MGLGHPELLAKDSNPGLSGSRAKANTVPRQHFSEVGKGGAGGRRGTDSRLGPTLVPASKAGDCLQGWARRTTGCGKQGLIPS